MANTNTKNAPRGTKIKESFGSRLFDIVDILIVCLLLACVLIPLVHIVAASFSNPSLFVGHKGILLWPEGFSLASYQAVFKNAFLWTGYANTLFIVLVGTVLNVLLSMVAAYCLSRKRVAAGPTIMKLLVFTMYFSGGMIPLYLVVKGVGLYGSRWALILPTLFCENFECLDDYAGTAYFASFLRVLKYISFYLSIFLPGVFVCSAASILNSSWGGRSSGR